MTEPTLTSSVAKVPALVEQAGDAPAPTCGPAGPRTPAAPTPPTGGISRPGLRLPACSPFRQHRRPWASTWPPRLRTSGLALLLATWWPLRPPIGQPGNRSIPVPLTLAGIKRTHGTNQNGKAPAVIADLRAMISAQPDTLAGLRDRALLLLGFAGALRRSELVGLDVEDLDFTSAGLVVTLRRSKTDQDGGGRRVGVPYGSRTRNPSRADVTSPPIPTGKAASAVCAWATRPSLSSSSGLRRRRASIRRGTPVTRCVPVLRPRPPLPGPRSAPSWPRRGIGSRGGSRPRVAARPGPAPSGPALPGSGRCLLLKRGSNQSATSTLERQISAMWQYRRSFVGSQMSKLTAWSAGALQPIASALFRRSG